MHLVFCVFDFTKTTLMNIPCYVSKGFPEMEEKNYILLTFLFLKDSIVSPAVKSFLKLQRNEKLFIGFVLALCLWLPLFIAFFWALPLVLLFTILFYSKFFGAEVLKKHLREAVQEASGISSKDDLFSKSAELAKSAGITDARLDELDQFVKQNTQRMIRLFASLSVIVLETVLKGVQVLEGFVRPHLDEQRKMAKSD